ncbi:thiol peroxidase [Dactylosporangium sp. NPDC000555]|uniref:thiol peroxidase n=1 Tax=Dactylosporangium sp. NPDC000555 TaxID=3154260 RepID=UPI00331AD2D8
MTATVERSAAVTLRGRKVTLIGPELRAGDTAPPFTVLAPDMTPVTIGDLPGRVRLLSSVPSLDTEVCDLETRRFDEEAARLEGLSVLTVSVDLPFAQQRWVSAADVRNVRTASDHRDLAFGHAYGVAVKDLRLLARAVFVVAADNTIRHVEYVPEIGAHPDYDAVLRAVRAELG